MNLSRRNFLRGSACVVAVVPAASVVLSAAPAVTAATTAHAVAADELSTASGKLGAVNSGRLISADGRTVIDMMGNFIRFHADATAEGAS